METAEAVFQLGAVYEIIWEDVQGGGILWTNLEEIEEAIKGNNMLFKTVGYVVLTTKGKVVLAATQCADAPLEESTLGQWTSIPHILIRSVKCISTMLD